MYYIVESDKPFDQAASDLEAAVGRHQFGVLHVHDLGATLRARGVGFEEECRVFEVCNPGQAARVLAVDMRLNMVLPCRVSVYTERGATRIGLVRPAPMLESLSREPALMEVAREVEETLVRIVDEAR